MQTQVKAHRWELAPAERAKLDEVIRHLDRLTETYEMRHLLVSVDRVGHAHECAVKMVLGLGRRRLIVEERGPAPGTAAQACVAVLARKIELAKERVHRRHGERAIRRSKAEASLVDPEALRAAAAAGDFSAFRDSLREAPDAIEAELARRLKRHPEADALLGDDFVIADLVEAVIERAYRDFASRPASVSILDWLLRSIDPVLEALAEKS